MAIGASDHVAWEKVAVWVIRVLNTIGILGALALGVLGWYFSDRVRDFIHLPTAVGALGERLDEAKLSLSRLEGLDELSERVSAQEREARALGKRFDERLHDIERIHLRLMGGFEPIRVGVLSDEHAANHDLSREDVIWVPHPDHEMMVTQNGTHRPLDKDDYILLRREVDNITVVILQRIKLRNPSAADRRKGVNVWMTRAAAERLGVSSQSMALDMRLVQPEEVQFIRARKSAGEFVDAFAGDEEQAP